MFSGPQKAVGAVWGLYFSNRMLLFPNPCTAAPVVEQLQNVVEHEHAAYRGAR